MSDQQEGAAKPGGGGMPTMANVLEAAARAQLKPGPLRRWNVVLLDDEDHTYDYVIGMMGEVFAHSREKAVQIAAAVDGHGRAVCLTTHKEHAEFKRDQILGYGKDRHISRCAGSMSAIIEPADFGEDNGRDAGKDGGGPGR